MILEKDGHMDWVELQPVYAQWRQSLLGSSFDCWDDVVRDRFSIFVGMKVYFGIMLKLEYNYEEE